MLSDMPSSRAPTLALGAKRRPHPYGVAGHSVTPWVDYTNDHRRPESKDKLGSRMLRSLPDELPTARRGPNSVSDALRGLRLFHRSNETQIRVTR